MNYNNVILIDTSYTSFYRFFATRTWYSMAHKDDFKEIKDLKNYNWLENKTFIDKYEKMYLDSIKKLTSAKVFKDSLVIFAIDPPQQTIWRMEEKSDYKDGRQDLTEKHNFKPVFKHTYNILIPGWVNENKNFIVIKQDKIEADDVIALSCKYIQSNFKNKSIYIVSGDEDFLQLGNDDVYFAQYKKKKVFQLTKEEAVLALVKKIIEGDCSDNIESIFKGKRVKNKKDLINDPNLLQEYLDKNVNIKEKFIKNQKLIDFNYIPKKYTTKFNNIIKKLLL
jgi:5'-3' exonuclease